MIKIWLDDLRPMPKKFNYHARSANEAIDKINEGQVSAISFDHDLGDGGTGYEVACHIEKLAFQKLIPPMHFEIHSQNPVGVMKIREALRRARDFWSINQL